MIIGLTGKYAAGKGTVAEHLKQKGFYYFSLSDILREEAKAKGLEMTRENLINLGNDLRKKHGNSVLADRILQKLEKDKNYVVDSFRNPDEVKAFKRMPNFHLWLIDAPLETRFKRNAARNRPEDPKSLVEFKRLEAAEEKGNPHSQQLLECAKMAEKTIVNDAALDKLHKKVDSTLSELPQHFYRPSWDEYFINIAKEVASRSNCVKRKVAAVIVKDKRIISTGYNGTPRGVKNCNEGGCPRCNSFAASGTKLDECLCSHAEENAIVQSAYHGIELKGATLYNTLSPCLTCAKMIINAGIAKVVYNQDYPLAEAAANMLKEAGIELVQFKID